MLKKAFIGRTTKPADADLASGQGGFNVLFVPGGKAMYGATLLEPFVGGASSAELRANGIEVDRDGDE